MADPLFFAPQRTPVIDARTGLMSREWYLFFQALWLRVGGVAGQSVDDLLQNEAEGVNTADVMALTFAGFNETGQLPTVVAELREKINDLTNEVQALRQGPVM
jgi:hypothetical protein